MKKQEKTEITKERIIQAAMQEFGNNGYKGTALNGICNHYDISKGLLYHNFTGKEELYLICVKRCFEALAEYLQNQKSELDIRTYLKVRFAYFAENPLDARIFFEAVLQPPQKLEDDIKNAKKPLDDLNRDIYKKALSKVELRAGVTMKDALKYYELIQEMLNSYFNSPASYGKDFDTIMEEHEDALEKTLDFILFGIAERGSDK